MKLEPVAGKGNQELIDKMTQNNILQKELLLELQLANEFNRDITDDDKKTTDIEVTK